MRYLVKKGDLMLEFLLDHMKPRYYTKWQIFSKFRKIVKYNRD
jgi:hypothetical protein